MDFKVYTKQTAYQPDESGQEVLKDNIIDIIPQFNQEDTVLLTTEIVEGREETIQACCLSCIYQYGLDPLDLTDGVRWSEVLLEEISAITLMSDLTNAVSKVSQNASVTFGTAIGADGESYMTYTIEVDE